MERSVLFLASTCLSLPLPIAISCAATVLSKPQVFLGGAVLADIIKDKEDVWISKKEYDEQGLGVLSKLGVSA